MNSPQGNWQAIADQMKRKIWITRGARFNAHQRLQNRHNWSIASISFLSAYVIAISLLTFIPAISLTSKQNTIISFSAIALSLFILVLSLLESSKSYESKGREFHECGRELSGVLGKLSISMEFWKSNQNQADIQKELIDIDNEYNQILDRCHENHETIDVDLFKLENQKDESLKLSVLERISIRFRIFVNRCFPCILFVVIPPIAVVFLLLFVK